jgi:hypothetical protein
MLSGLPELRRFIRRTWVAIAVSVVGLALLLVSTTVGAVVVSVGLMLFPYAYYGERRTGGT